MTPKQTRKSKVHGAPLGGDKLKVFISSKMIELRDLRELIKEALDKRGLLAWVYEDSAGARPEGIGETSLTEVEDSDIYVGLFWRKYGEVTIKEYRRARALDKPCFVYIREKDAKRDKNLKEFLQAEIYDLSKGVTYDYFDSALQVAHQIADDIMNWLVRRHRQMTAEIRESRVSQDAIDALQKEVVRLQSLSRNPLPSGTVIDYLMEKMEAWFKTLGYRFEGYSARSDDYFEWVVQVPARRGFDRILVRGIEGVAEIPDIRALRQSVEAQKTDEGWLVAARRKSPAACEETKKDADTKVFCYTLDELVDENAAFSRYLDWLERQVKDRGIDRLYVPLACVKHEFGPASKTVTGESIYDATNGWIDGYIDRWLDDPAKEHISILGEFGTGKTWFALHYAWVALQRYRDAKARGVERPRIPLVIPLRDYAKAVSAESLVSEFFFRKHEIRLPGYSAFDQLNRMGKLLLIFDGFDEMAAKIDRQKMVNNFWEIARLVVPGAKAILTCRSEYFPDAQEERKLLGAQLKASTASLTGEPPQFEVLELKKLSDKQIRDVLKLRTNVSTVQKIIRNPQLLDLARRPVMLELILDALPAIDAGKPVDLVRVYLYAVENKMSRDIKAERTFTSLADKLYFLCELAWEMLSTNQMSINYRLFPERLSRLFGDVVKDQKDMDHWHYDMMGQTMLVRNEEGDYTPAHRSLMEFFVAYKFAAELGVLAADFTALAKMQSGAIDLARSIDYKWSRYFHRRRGTNAGTENLPELRSFIREDLDMLAQTVGQSKFSVVIVDMLKGMLGPDDATATRKLWEIIEETRGRTVKEVMCTGGNVASLLRYMGVSLKGRKLSGTVLVGADLHGVDLTRTDFAGSALCASDFRTAVLRDANWSNADLRGIRLGEWYWIRAVALDKDERRILVGGGNAVNPGRTEGAVYNFVSVLDCIKGAQIINSIPGTQDIWTACLSPDGKYGSIGGDDNNIFILSMKTGKVIRSLPTSGGRVTYLQFSVDGKRLFFVDDAGLHARDSKSLGEDWLYPTPRYSYGCASNPYGGRIALASIDTKHVDIIDVRNGDLIERLKVRVPRFCWPRGICINAAGTVLAALFEGGRHSHIQIWGARRPRRMKLFTIPMAFETIGLSPDGSKVVCGARDNTLRIFDVRNGKELRRLTGHDDTVSAVQWNSDGTTIISGSWDSTVRIWDADPKSATFGQCKRTMAVQMVCDGLQLVGAKGLNAEGPSGGDTALQWLKARGAA